MYLIRYHMEEMRYFQKLYKYQKLQHYKCYNNDNKKNRSLLPGRHVWQSILNQKAQL